MTKVVCATSPCGVRDVASLDSANTETGSIIETSVDIYTEQIFMRARARQMAIEVASTELNVQWQLGSPRLDGRPDGRR